MSNVGTRFEPGWRATSNVNPNPNGKLSSARAGKVSPVAPMIVTAISEMAARRDNTVTEIIKTLGACADGSSGGCFLPNVCEIDQIMAAQISSRQKHPRDMVHDRHARGCFAEPGAGCYCNTIAVNG
jgi:hypothetical protein